MSKTSRRSGLPKTPKFDRCASPQSWTRRLVVGVLGEVARHDQGGAAVEGERRDQHAPVADRHELGHARRGLALEQGDRVRAARAQRQLGVGRARHLGARGLAAGDALGQGQVLDPRPDRHTAVVAGGRRHVGSHLSRCHGLRRSPTTSSARG